MIGSCTGRQEKLCPEENFNWKHSKIKVLGIWLPKDPETTTNTNFSEKIQKLRNCLGCWSLRRLSLIGKITVLNKCLATSQIIILLTPIQSNPKIIKQINDLFFHFLWNDKGDKIKKNVMIQNFAEGGLKMIDTTSFNKALKTVWIKRIFVWK